MKCRGIFKKVMVKDVIVVINIKKGLGMENNCYNCQNDWSSEHLLKIQGHRRKKLVNSTQRHLGSSTHENNEVNETSQFSCLLKPCLLYTSRCV